jgi:hypothetical protein
MTGKVMTQDEDGNWVEAVPLGPQGPVAKLEFWLRDRGWTRLSHILGRFDERGL